MALILEVYVNTRSSPSVAAYGRALTLGFVAGLRSQVPLALLAAAMYRGGFAAEAAPPLGWLRSPRVAAGLGASALGEIVGDKLPFVPNRTELGPLGGRIAFGGLAGAAVALGSGQTAAIGAALGGVGGAVGTFAGYHGRVWLGRATQLPDPIWAVAEDVIAVGLGLLATPNLLPANRRHPPQP